MKKFPKTKSTGRRGVAFVVGVIISAKSEVAEQAMWMAELALEMFPELDFDRLPGALRR